MEDNYRRHVNRQATDRQLLGVARATTLLARGAAAVCAFFFSNVADILAFIYDFWAPTMIVPFLVAVFWYDRSRIHAVVISMIVGGIATVVWRFGLGSPGDIGPALFGFAAASVAFLLALPLTRGWTISPLFQPNDQEEMK